MVKHFDNSRELPMKYCVYVDNGKYYTSQDRQRYFHGSTYFTPITVEEFKKYILPNLKEAKKLIFTDILSKVEQIF